LVILAPAGRTPTPANPRQHTCIRNAGAALKFKPLVLSEIHAADNTPAPLGPFGARLITPKLTLSDLQQRHERS
jgi:hypothetical protein